MTLEDFFTLTEMKDGLTAPSRVQELISVMQKEKDCVVKNVGDAMRQWAAVASTIAATDNKDCLDLFIQSDGLWFLNRWLQDAQNVGDTNEGFIEESITALLRAVEKLHLDPEKSMSSGILVTVKNLIGHHSSKVKDGAKVLFESWKVGGNGEADSHDLELVGGDNESDKVVREEGQPSAALSESMNEKELTAGLVADEKSPSRSTSSLQPERNASVQIQSSRSQLHSSGSLDGENIKQRSPDHLANDSTSTKEEAAPTKEELPSSTVSETLSAGSHSFPHPKQDNFDGKSDVNDSTKLEKQEQNSNGPLEKLGVSEISLGSRKPDTGPTLKDANEAEAPEFVNEPAVHQNVENNEDIVCHNATAASSMKTRASDRKSGVDDARALKSGSPQPPKAAENDGGCCTNALQESSVSGGNLGKPEVFDMSFSRTERASAIKEDPGHISNEGKESSKVSDPIKPRKHRRGPNMIDKKSSDIELDYGIVDALEVACQVAQEVEREVCSSSEKISEGGTGQPHSPDSVGKEDASTCAEPREVQSKQSYSAEIDAKEERHDNISDGGDSETGCVPDMESSHVIESALDPGCNSVKNLCAFDLNEEFGSDDMDNSANVMSTPIPVVSASKPPATPGMPVAPLRFEGALGWTGSAATSAFRPASPRKNSSSEKNISISGNSDISKQRQDCLDIDLNVAESEDGLGKQIAESSGLPSGQSSAELSPMRSRRIELDLNSAGDDVDAQPSDQRMEGQLLSSRIGHWSPSPASSTSSMQPSVRNIDLNDRPFLQTDLVDQGPSKSSHILNACGFSKPDAPVISLLGTRVEVGRKEARPSPNGKATESTMDLTISRDGVLGMGPASSYSHSPAFGYNGLTTVSPLSFSSTMYGSGGPVPYMMDSRGAPVVPQVVGSSPTILSSYSQPPFLMNLTGVQLGLNGVGPSRPNFDLNTGSGFIEGGNRDALAARQFFLAGQNRAIEEQVRNIHQPSTSSGVGGKRKEPDSGWETYPFSYKPQPPWK
ncbi:hypothetical protein QN277_018238 [Acacia crassicarpa]|uniref:TFIIS N-terminal domain-containing protein n=1 Tax=Acacia crassicarpa TaxID=499986 RepID=A0AAE1JU31_9FABA|nr:hypothetical protein QN277_018238 [Acacia crassicarpa]